VPEREIAGLYEPLEYGAEKAKKRGLQAVNLQPFVGCTGNIREKD